MLIKFVHQVRSIYKISATCVPYLLTVTMMERYMRHWNPCHLCIWFLGVFAELRKATSSFVMSARMELVFRWTDFSF